MSQGTDGHEYIRIIYVRIESSNVKRQKKTKTTNTASASAVTVTSASTTSSFPCVPVRWYLAMMKHVPNYLPLGIDEVYCFSINGCFCDASMGLEWIKRTFFYREDSQTILYFVVVLVVARIGTILENITKLWIVLPLHLQLKFWKIVPSSIFI